MNAKGIMAFGLAAVCLAAVYQSDFPKPRHMKLDKRHCKWVVATPANAGHDKKTLKCALTSSMALVLDSAGIGTGGGPQSAKPESAGVGSGGGPKNLSCVWGPVMDPVNAPPKQNIECTIAVAITIDSAGIGTGGGPH